MKEEKIDELFSELEVTFHHYYKYSFYYQVEYDGYVVQTSYGGTPNEIYRHDVVNNEFWKLGKVSSYSDMWSSVCIIKDGIEIFNWYD